jgi:hypothetical protein
MIVRPHRPLLLAAIISASSAIAAYTATRSIPASGNKGLDRIDQVSGTDGLYHYAATGAGVNIFIVDTGIGIAKAGGGADSQFVDVEPNRLHLVGNFDTNPGHPSPNDDLHDCDVGGVPNDDHGHGSHQASFAAGSTYGVAKDAQVWILKAAGGSACAGTDAAVAAAIRWVTWAYAHPSESGVSGPAVVNISFGLESAGDAKAAIREAFAAPNAGFVYTLSAGCAPNTASIYGGANDVTKLALIVGGTNISDVPGQTGYGGGLTLYAPAQGLNVASAERLAPYTTPATCVDSYAAPHVAGVAAMYLERHPRATPLEVRTAILRAGWKSATLPDGKVMVSSRV